jgi:hypothetical protein
VRDQLVHRPEKFRQLLIAQVKRELPVSDAVRREVNLALLHILLETA